MAYEIKYRSDNEMKDSGIEWLGKIPKEWEVLRNKNIFEHRPKIFNRSDNTTVLSLTIKGVKVKTDLSFGKSTESYIGHQMVKRGELIFTPRDFDATPILSGIAPEDGCISNLYFVLKTNNITTEKYVNYYWWGLKYGYDYFKKQSYGIRYSFNQEQFSIIPFIKPNTIEQHKIANFLDIKTSEFDSIISKKERLIEKLQEAKKSLISEVVTGKVKIVDGELVEREPEEMKDSGVEWLGMIPKDWEVKMVKHIVNIFRGRFNHRPRNDIRLYENGTHPFIQTGDIAKSNKYLVSYSQTLNEKGARISATFPIDTLLMTIAANIGDLSIAKIKAYYPDSIVGFYPKSNINEEYLYLLFSSMKDEFLRTSIINTQANLNIERIGSINTTIPTGADEVVSITKYLNKEAKNLDSIITKTQKQITKLKEAKQSLISEAVTGKIDLRDWEIIETGGR